MTSVDIGALYTRIKRKAEREISKCVYQENINIVLDKPVISFTFDDVYASAIDVGAKILERNGVRGTYYVAMGLTGLTDSVGRFHREEDLAVLVAAEHEIGCHTNSHLACGDVSVTAYLDDVVSNNQRFEELFPNKRLRNFSYPYGQLSPPSKNALAQRFECLRSTQPGINVGKTDIRMLKAHRLYEGSTTRERARELIDLNRATNGWLIFYTHDISESPSRYGCTSGLFEVALNAALESGARILTVDRAIQFVQSV